MEEIVLEKNQYYWIKDQIKEYVPAMLIDDKSSDNGTNTVYRFELFESHNMHNKAEITVPFVSIVGRVPNPATVHLTRFPDDLVNSADISEQSILWCLEKRFARNAIYSSIGPILIALNPYRNIDGLYTQETLQSYVSTQMINPVDSQILANSKDAQKPLAPHVWTIAHNAYHRLVEQNTKQAIIISGESGSYMNIYKYIYKYLSVNL